MCFHAASVSVEMCWAVVDDRDDDDDELPTSCSQSNNQSSNTVFCYDPAQDLLIFERADWLGFPSRALRW